MPKVGTIDDEDDVVIDHSDVDARSSRAALDGELAFATTGLECSTHNRSLDQSDLDDQPMPKLIGRPRRSSLSIRASIVLLNDDGPEEAQSPKAPDGATYTERFARDVCRLMVRHKVENVNELIHMLGNYQQSINESFTVEFMDQVFKPRKASLSTRDSVAVPEGDDVDKPFSVRLLPSWKLALQRNRERKREQQRSELSIAGHNSFFSEVPLVCDDHAETVLPADAYSTDEQRRQEGVRRFLRRYYTIITLIATVIHVYNFVNLLFRMCFSIPYEEVGYAMDWIVAELPMIFFAILSGIAPKEVKGVYKVNLRDQVRSYVLSSRFAIDVVGILPLDIVGFAIGSNCTTLVRRCGILAPYWKVNRVLLSRYAFFNVGDVLEELTMVRGYHPSIARIIQTFIQFALLSHISTCIQSVMLDNDNVLIDTWLKDAVYMKRDLFTRYLQGLDWSTKSIVGFWKGEPFNIPDTQVIFTLVVCFAGILVFSSFVGAITAYIQRPSAWRVATEAVDGLIDEFHHRNLPQEFLREAAQFYWHLFNTAGHGDGVIDAVAELPKNLQVRVLHQVGLDLLRRVPLLTPEMNNQHFVMALTVSLIPHVLPPYTVLFRKGDRGDSMGFVTSGSLGVVPPSFETSRDLSSVFFVLKTGSFLGEIALILGVPRTATVSSLQHFSNLLILNEDNFRQIASDFPNVVRRMRIEAESRLTVLNDGPEALNRERARRLHAANDFTIRSMFFTRWMTVIKLNARIKARDGGLVTGTAALAQARRRSISALSGSFPNGELSNPLNETLYTSPVVACSFSETDDTPTGPIRAMRQSIVRFSESS